MGKKYECILHQKKYTRMVNKHWRDVPTSLICREIKIKTMHGTTVYPLEWLKFLRLSILIKDVEELELPYTVDRHSTTTFAKFSSFLKKFDTPTI